MNIIKRDGSKVSFNPAKITKRIKVQSKGLKVDADSIAIKVIAQIKDNITTKELDLLAIEQSATLVTYHPDYSKLSARLSITLNNKYTLDKFSDFVNLANETTTLLSKRFTSFVEKYREFLDSIIVQKRDFNHDYFGLKTLEKSYLIRDAENNVIERPQYMWLRTAIEVSNYNIDEVLETYTALSEGYYTHATPTLFNSGTTHSQLSSCFLLGMKGDSIKGIFDTVSDCAAISKWAGGIGIHAHDIRSTGSKIHSTNGFSTGLVPMLKVFNETARYVDQGGGKRKGSFAIYLEPWHSDIFDFLDLKKNHGKEEMRARDLFYAMWIPDLFMEKVEQNADWHLFCPNIILNKYGKLFSEKINQEFVELYERAVSDGNFVKKVKARELWEKILVSQIETGTPYLGYKDIVNTCNNQKNYGVIKSSNLCIEINEYSDGKEQAVCNLASIALSKFVKRDINDKPYFDFIELRKYTKLAIKNLDNVIDTNFYPTSETEISNNKHRPVGLGVQGLADTFALMEIAFDGEKAKFLNKAIFENMYYAALEQSKDMAITKGKYSTFDQSPAASGLLQFDLYDNDIELDNNLDWDKLKQEIVKYGLRNSLLIALMPTASTSQILGNNECFEPFTSNLSIRRVLSGEFIIINKHLIRDLEKINLWTPNMRLNLLRENGSVQNIASIPTEIKERYKTAYDISMKTIIDLAADRQRFVCQAQSMNLFLESANIAKLTSMHFYGWKKKLKTGMYYLRTKPAVSAKQFTLEKENIVDEVQAIDPEEYKKMILASSQQSDDCEMCGA